MSLTQLKDHPASPPSTGLPAPQGADPAYFLPRVEAGRLAGILMRRGWMVVLLTLAGAAAFHSFAARLQKTYRATGSVYVNSQAPAVLNIRAVAPEETRDLEQMRSVEQGMQTSTLLMRVVEANHLAEDPTYAPKGTGPEALVKKFASHVKIELGRGTRLINLQVEDSDPVRAKALVESLVDEYQRWTNERQIAITRQVSEGLAREEERLRAGMEMSAKRLQEFRQDHPVPGLEGNGGIGQMRDPLATLNSQLTDATAARLKLEAEFEAYVKFDAEKPEALAGLGTSERGTEVLSQVRAIQQKEADFSRIKQRYLYKHPAYMEIANEIASMKSTLAETVKSAGQALEQRYRVAKENEYKLSGEVARARGEAVDVEGIREKFRAMSRDADADYTLHDSVALRLRETTMAASVPASFLRWENMPMVPEKAVGPRKMVFAGAGAFLGFCGGVLLLLGVELGDRRVRDPAAAARATGSPLLATLPCIDSTSDGMVLLSDPSSACAEAFRRLRAILAPPPGGTMGRTVLFASARSGEGKSFCALNYATSLAIQGHRTLLLDADLRRPGLSRQLVRGADETAGLGGYLAGANEASEACFTTALPNLYMISSGPMRPDAAELLGGTRFPSLLEDAFRWFDRVVIDTSPVLSVSDMLAIARYADRTCMVVRDRSCQRHDLKRAADLVRSAGGNLAGFIWNEAGEKNSNTSSPGPAVPINRIGIEATSPASAPTAISPGNYPRIPKFC